MYLYNRISLNLLKKLYKKKKHLYNLINYLVRYKSITLYSFIVVDRCLEPGRIEFRYFHENRDSVQRQPMIYMVGFV